MTKKTTLKTLRQRCSDLVRHFTSSLGFSTCSKVTKIRSYYVCLPRATPNMLVILLQHTEYYKWETENLQKQKKKEVINRIILVNSTGRVYVCNMTSAYFSVTFQVTLRA